MICKLLQLLLGLHLVVTFTSLRPALAAASPSSQAASAQPATVKVAAIQFRSEFGNAADNRNRLEVLIRQAAASGAKIVVVPETAITGYMTTDLKTTWFLDGWPITEKLNGVSPESAAEPVPGPSTEAFAKVAKQLGIYLTVPLLAGC